MLSDFVKYVKQYWHDRPDKSTPLNADRLNHIENGIEANANAIDEIANAVVSNIVNDPEKIASMAAVYALQEKLGTGELPSDAPNAISAINTLYSNLDFSYLIKKAKILDPNTDLNIITESGIYYLNGTATWGNSPNSEVTNCYLLVFTFKVSRCTQIILPGNDEFIYYRSKYTDNETWLIWKRVNK